MTLKSVLSFMLKSCCDFRQGADLPLFWHGLAHFVRLGGGREEFGW